MAGAVHATIKLDGVTLHTLARPAGGLASDAIAALKTDTGTFLTTHMAESGAAAAAGDDINMLEEEISADEGDEEKKGRHPAKRKREKKAA